LVLYSFFSTLFLLSTVARYDVLIGTDHFTEERKSSQKRNISVTIAQHYLVQGTESDESDEAAGTTNRNHLWK
jgi:hypothetical protein